VEPFPGQDMDDKQLKPDGDAEKQLIQQNVHVKQRDAPRIWAMLLRLGFMALTPLDLTLNVPESHQLA
jgi:hypothetical protein